MLFSRSAHKQQTSKGGFDGGIYNRNFVMEQETLKKASIVSILARNLMLDNSTSEKHTQQAPLKHLNEQDGESTILAIGELTLSGCSTTAQPPPSLQVKKVVA
jgi:hypothetical protein